MSNGHKMQWAYDDIFERGRYAEHFLSLEPTTWFIPVKDHGKLFNAVVDKEDWLHLVRFAWNTTKTGFLWRNAYEGADHDMVYMHVEVMARKLDKTYRDIGARYRRKDDVIFKDGDKLNCTRDNLELSYRGKQILLSEKQNVRNTSGLRGVKWDDKRQRWVAQIQYQKQHYQKRFKEKQDAISWRKNMELDLTGKERDKL